MTTAYSAYVFTGSSATTLTVPAISGTTGVFFWIENRGTATVTLSNSSAIIYFTSAVTSHALAAGAGVGILSDGTYWNIISTDAANNMVGTLPVANGGTGQTSLTSLTLTTPIVTGYTETVQALGALTAGTTVLSLSGGTFITATLPTGAVTFTMPTKTAGQSFVLLLKQNATPTGTATFTSVIWPGVGAPTITTTASSFDMLTFFTDGTSWYGSYVQGYS
jgi:hypothetical protein